jgi:SWI/SNF-related matrix-associated actin-dependent regulator 1 of chromatin subfamily A
MIRRLKRDVLTQLPAKRRTRVVVELPPKARLEMQRRANELEEARARANAPHAFSSHDELDAAPGGGGGSGSASGGSVEDGSWLAMAEHRRLLSEAYRATGEAKLPGVCDYVATLIEGLADSAAPTNIKSSSNSLKSSSKSNASASSGGSDSEDASSSGGGKLLVFAHHLTVLDGIQATCARAKVGFIRIDGRVPGLERQKLVTAFQTDPAVKVAVLGLTAAGQGLTLTAASTVVFAELHWTPGVIVQAEDRAHRIGQRQAVNVVYLVAQGDDGIDGLLWQCIGRKVVSGRPLSVVPHSQTHNLSIACLVLKTAHNHLQASRTRFFSPFCFTFRCADTPPPRRCTHPP